MEETIRPFGPEEFGEVLLGGGRPATVEVLLRRPPPDTEFEALPDPFARIDDAGGAGGLFLVRLEGGGAGVRHAALKVERDDCGPGERDPEAVDRAGLLLEDYRRLRRLGAEPNPPVTGVLPSPGLEDGQGGLRPLPPLFFCKRRRMFFQPPCPRCGGALDEASDDALAVAGLPPVSESGRRYLHCRACGGEGRLYTCTVEERDPATVGDRWELVRGYAGLVADPGGAADPTFPCLCCASAAGCHPPGDTHSASEAQQLLVPFSFHRFRAFLHEFLPLRYDEACDLLGAVPWATVEDAIAARREPERLAVARAERPEGQTTGFLFGDSGDGRLACESLWLKLSVFAELCRAVRAVHVGLERPHLNLRPASVWLGFPGANRFLPRYWNFALRLAGLDGARPLPGRPQGEGEAAGGALLLPPAEFDRPFAHPAIAEGRFGQFAPGRLAVTGVEAGAEDGSYVLSGRLTGGGRATGAEGPDDRVEVSLGRGYGFRGDLPLTFRVAGRDDDGVLLRSQPVSLGAGELEPVKALQTLPHVDVTFRVWHRFGPECDLFGLGMLLFRALFADGTPTARERTEHCRAAAERIGRSTGGRPEAAEAAVEREVGDESLAPPAVPGAVPGPLWGRALALGFRLATELPGFSYWTGAVVEPWQALDRVLEDLEALRNDVRSALFAASPAEPAVEPGEIRAVLEDLIGDPDWLERISGSGSPPPPAAPRAREAPPPADAEAPGLETTEIIGAPSAARRPAAPAGAAPEPEGLDTTVILRPDRTAAKGDAPAAAGADDLVTTREVAGGVTGSVGPEEGEALDATVILRPGAAPTAGRRPPAPAPPAGSGPEGEGEPGTGDDEDEDRLLETTVILRPGQFPKGKK